MTENEFISLAVNQFSTGQIVIVSGKNGVLTNDLLCRAKDAMELAGKQAMVLDANTFVGYPRDVFFGSQFWQASNYYPKGVTVFPTSYVDDGVLYDIPFNCSPTILPRFRYKCTTNGMTAATEPSWPLVEGTAVIDGRATWIAETLIVSGLTWEMILLQSREGDGFVALVHNEFDPDGPRAISGDLVTDVCVDLTYGFGPGGNMLKHKAYSTRDIFPYFSQLFYHEDLDVQFIKSQTPAR